MCAEMHTSRAADTPNSCTHGHRPTRRSSIPSTLDSGGQEASTSWIVRGFRGASRGQRSRSNLAAMLTGGAPVGPAAVRLPSHHATLRTLSWIALLAYPVITLVAVSGLSLLYSLSRDWWWLPICGPIVAFLGFVGIGASARAPGGVLRGALAGAGLYLLIGAMTATVYALRFGTQFFGFVYVALSWPLSVLTPSFWAGGA